MKKRGLIILISIFCITGLFSKTPNGAKEIFHLKVEQENRFFISHIQSENIFKSSSWSDIYMTNGAMLEFSFKSFTISSSLLTDYNIGKGVSKIDLDLGYEHTLRKNLKLQPFIGSEFNSNGAGITFGAKLNQGFEIFDNASLGLFAGCRYSKSKDFSSRFLWHEYSDYVSASVGIYLMVYTYKRHEIIEDW